MKSFLIGSLYLAACHMDNEMYILLKEIKKDVTPTADEIRYHRENDLEIDERAHQMTILQADCPAKCKECVEQGVKRWYHYVFQKLDAWCNSDDKCPIKKRVCKLKDEHPKVLAGMLYIWGQPATSEYFFCMGEKLCDIPNDAIDQLKETFDYMTIDDSSSWRKSAQDGQCESELHSFGDDTPCYGDDCPNKCEKDATCKVMKHVIDEIKEWCKKATKKCDVEKCEWMKDHKEFTFGVLLAAVQPWKYAYGYCYPHDSPLTPKQELASEDLEFDEGMFLA